MAMSHPHILIPRAYTYTIKVIRYDNLSDYPWIRNDEHLKRINRYRKRVGQVKLIFSDEDMAELILLRSGR